MKYSISPMGVEERVSVMDIFNHYVENSFAAYRQDRLPNEAFDDILASAKSFPTGIIRNETGKVLGFGLLRAHKDNPGFAHTGEAMYFLHPDYCGAGLGKLLLNYLEEEGKKRAITTLLVNISSKNKQSLQFHSRNGFKQCGCFEGIGKKNGETFDVIWMQKML